ncbi:MAG: hypothetical protein JO362_20935 [Streptomycetaceae bacterium]|nr:hypothetical protein [Streptomycetaceae bacterium]
MASPSPIFPSDPSFGREPDAFEAPTEDTPTSAPHWPGSVQRPGSPGFAQSAGAWLFDLAPPRYRYEEVLHRHPVELAQLVRLRLQADVVAMDAALRTLRERARTMPAEVPYLTDLYTRERDWARAMLEQVALVEQGLKTVAGPTRIAHIPGPRRATG